MEVIRDKGQMASREVGDNYTSFLEQREKNLPQYVANQRVIPQRFNVKKGIASPTSNNKINSSRNAETHWALLY